MADESFGNGDIILHSRDNTLKRVCKTHRPYENLQYPLPFDYRDGYHFGIPQLGNNPRKHVLCLDFDTYPFMIRDNSYNHLQRT